MKNIILVLLSVIIAATSCRKSEDTPKPPAPDDGRIRFTSVDAVRYADQSTSAADYILMRFSTEDYAPGSGKGSLMHLWCYVPHSDEAFLANGTYSPGFLNSYIPFTFIPGIVDDNGTSGSYILSYDTTTGVARLSLLTGGTFSVSKSGDTYTITFDLTNTGAGFELKGKYENAISFSDEGEFDHYTPFPEATAVFTGNGQSAAWRITLTDTENDTTKGLVIETHMAPDYGFAGYLLELRDYTVSTTALPGTLVKGSAPTTVGGLPSGSYYFEKEKSAPGFTLCYLITGGQMGITRSGAEYRITTDLSTEDLASGAKSENAVLKFEGYPDYADESGSTPPLLPSIPPHGEIVPERLDLGFININSRVSVYPSWATGMDSHHWLISAGSDDVRHQVYLEFFSDPNGSTTELPEGQFPIAWNTGVYNKNSSEPGYFVPEANEYRGCHYIEFRWPTGNYLEVPIVPGGGFVNIEKHGKDNLVSFHLYDYGVKRITGKYFGKVSVQDESIDN